MGFKKEGLYTVLPHHWVPPLATPTQQAEHVLEDYSGGEGVASPQNDLHGQPMQGDDASCAEGEQRDIPHCGGEEEEVMEVGTTIFM